jgi:hypothetical protein
VSNDALARLARIADPAFQSTFLPEPELIFGDSRRTVDAKTGLGLFGPYDRTDPGRRRAVRVGIIGPGPTVDLAQRYIERCRNKVLPRRIRRVKGETVFRDMDPIAYTAFPGLAQVFDTDFVISDSLVETLSRHEIAQVTQIPLFEPRISALIQLIVGRMRVLADKDPPPDVVIVALSSELRKLCTTPTKHRSAGPDRSLAARLRKNIAKDEQLGQDNLFDVAAAHGIELDAPREDHSVFHHGLKARAMSTDLPTQLIWQETLEGAASVEDDATRAWNLWTGIYYKARGIPWRASGLSPGTCYVGIAFYRDRQDATLRTCMAQAFSDQGEGLVLRSEPFRWQGSRSPHVPRDLAEDLISRVLRAYSDHVRQPPRRVVVHKKQRFWDAERGGMEAALSGIVHSFFDLVGLGERGIRFFRVGAEPPLRGTMVHLGEQNAILYTQGFVPFLGAYQGMRVPRPVDIVEHIGDAPITQIGAEILALTKLDWNTAMFAGRLPITIAFAEDVGAILSELPFGSEPKASYRFYM